MHIRWDDEKNARLKAERGFGFEDVVEALEAELLLGEEPNPTAGREDQRVFYVRLDDYVVVVPYVRDEVGIFLKTAFASRKATRRFLRKD